MGVNFKGILEGVAQQGELGEPGKQGSVVVLGGGQLSGPEMPLEFQALGKGWPCGRVFSAGAFQAACALIPSLLCREMGAGKAPTPHTPTPPGSPPGEQDKKLDGA